MKSVQVESSAPGKLIIAGEYAVLHGWPALVCATDRRFKVTLTQNQQLGAGQVKVLSLGYHSQRSSEEIVCILDRERGLECSHSSALAMLCAGFNASLRHYDLSDSMAQADCGWTLVLDSRELFDAGDKLGLGSSAAMTVAVDHALRKLKTRLQEESSSAGTALSSNTAMSVDKALSSNTAIASELPERWLRLHRVHSAAQNKQGSGVDIAASLVDTASVFRNIEQANCELAPLTLPSGLHFLFLWSGQSASTPAHLRTFSAWKNQNGALFQSFMKELGGASKSCSDLGENAGTAADFVQRLSEFTTVLKRFDEASGVGVFEGGHARVYEASKNIEGLAYKPCGAGGGDLGLAASSNVQTLNNFAEQVSACGFRKINLSIESSGDEFH